MAKNEDGFDKLTNRDVSFIAFCDELRAYVEEHHLFCFLINIPD